MNKILMVMEDFSEMSITENWMRKMGFDVMCLRNDVSLSDTILGFPADIVLATGKGRYVDGARVVAKLKKAHYHGKVALLTPANAPLKLDEKTRLSVQAFIETPLDPRALLQILARLFLVDEVPLLEKYDKITGQKKREAEEIRILKEAPPPSGPVGIAAVAPSERELRYQKFLQEHQEPADKVLSHDALARKAKDLAEHAKKEKDLLEKIDTEKREFVKALYTPKKT